MKLKGERIVGELVRVLSSWKGVDTVVLGESAEEDMNDPYFFLSLDVYHRGTLPGPEARRTAFPESGAFESSRFQLKDRFLVEDLPVRLEYKEIDRIDRILERTEDLMWVFRETGTYMFYRFVNGTAVYRGSSWIDEVRARLSAIPEECWKVLAETQFHRMEHYLSDLWASVIREDEYFYLTSSAGFIRSACGLLFAINREFEPSDRSMSRKVEKLPRLPDTFRGYFESFLRQESDFDLSKKRQVAEHLAKEIISLYEG